MTTYCPLEILYLLENKRLRLFSIRGTSYWIIFQWVLIFEQPILKKAYLWFYKAHKNGTPIEIYSILQGISIGAYFPSKIDCKAHRRLFSMGPYFWIGAYFPVSTVHCKGWLTFEGGDLLSGGGLLLGGGLLSRLYSIIYGALQDSALMLEHNHKHDL